MIEDELFPLCVGDILCNKAYIREEPESAEAYILMIPHHTYTDIALVSLSDGSMSESMEVENTDYIMKKEFTDFIVKCTELVLKDLFMLKLKSYKVDSEYRHLNRIEEFEKIKKKRQKSFCWYNNGYED